MLGQQLVANIGYQKASQPYIIGIGFQHYNNIIPTLAPNVGEALEIWLLASNINPMLHPPWHHFWSGHNMSLVHHWQYDHWLPTLFQHSNGWLKVGLLSGSQ